MRKNLLIAITSLTLTLLFLEVAVRVLIPQPTDYFTFVKNPKPNMTIRRMGVEVFLNEDGVRDENHTTEKSGRRIALIGDSITHGVGVPFQEVYHQVAERLLQKEDPSLEVLAFNQGATSLDWAIKVYQEKVRKYQPDVVIHGFCLNDLLDYSSVGKKAPKSTKRHAYDLIANTHIYLRYYSHLYFLFVERSRRLAYKTILDRKVRTMDSWLPVLRGNEKQENELTKRLRSTIGMVQKLKAIVEADGAEFGMVIFPFEPQLSPELVKLYAKEYEVEGLSDAPKGIIQRRLLEALQEIGVAGLDLLPAYQSEYQKANELLFFRELGGMLDWAHPNTIGHRIAGEELARYIRENLGD